MDKTSGSNKHHKSQHLDEQNSWEDVHSAVGNGRSEDNAQLEKHGIINFNKYQCNTCLKCFRQFSMLLAHRHHSPCKFKAQDEKSNCKTCGSKYDPMTQANGSGDKCDKCRPHEQTKSVKKRKKTESDTDLYECSHCRELIKTKHDLIKHIRGHRRGGIYGCMYCTEAFESQAYLRRHMKSHFPKSKEHTVSTIRETTQHKREQVKEKEDLKKESVKGETHSIKTTEINEVMKVNEMELKNSANYMCKICLVQLRTKRLYAAHIQVCYKRNKSTVKNKLVTKREDQPSVIKVREPCTKKRSYTKKSKNVKSLPISSSLWEYERSMKCQVKVRTISENMETSVHLSSTESFPKNEDESCNESMRLDKTEFHHLDETNEILCTSSRETNSTSDGINNTDKVKKGVYKPPKMPQIKGTVDCVTENSVLPSHDKCNIPNNNPSSRESGMKAGNTNNEDQNVTIDTVANTPHTKKRNIKTKYSPYVALSLDGKYNARAGTNESDLAATNVMRHVATPEVKRSDVPNLCSRCGTSLENELSWQNGEGSNSETEEESPYGQKSLMRKIWEKIWPF